MGAILQSISYFLIYFKYNFIHFSTKKIMVLYSKLFLWKFCL